MAATERGVAMTLGAEDDWNYGQGYPEDDVGEAVDILPELQFHRANSDAVMYRPLRKSLKTIGPYMLGGRLGEGSYGKVKDALDSVTLCRRAVKIMRNRKLRKITNGQQNAKKEIQLLQRLRHHYIIQLVDVLYNHDKEKIYMIMEYCAGNMQEMLEKAPGKKMPFWQAQHYFRQLMEGVEYLHSQGVIHRDIKPGNLLIATDDTLRITDFGVADILNRYYPKDVCTRSSGTPAFQPPELANGAEVFSGYKVDIWACGVTLWNMTSGTYPFDGDSLFALYANIAKGEYTVPKDLPMDLTMLLEGMLTIDSKHRFTVAQVRHHAWVRWTLPVDSDAVVLAPLENNDPFRASSVLTFLEMEHFEPNSDEEFADEESITNSPPRKASGGRAPPPSPGGACTGGGSNSESEEFRERKNSAGSSVKRFFSNLFRAEDKSTEQPTPSA
eukprot:m.13615 g.13615  ORF g.13615 m.13615 type:complete len:442 (+) comp4604_c0_seq1:659-1984(+)